MRGWGARCDGGDRARLFVASVTRRSGFEVAPKGLCWGIRPRRLRRQFGDTTGEIGEAGLVGKAARQGDLDAGDHFGDAGRDLEQPEADGVELGIAPERRARAPARAGSAAANRQRYEAAVGTGWRWPWCTRCGRRRGAACAP